MFPRVLIINADPFSTKTATGLTLISLFKGWPVDRLACLYTSTLIGVPDTTVCKRYWFLSRKDLVLPYTNQPLTFVSSEAGPVLPVVMKPRKFLRWGGVANPILSLLQAGEAEVRTLIGLCRYNVSRALHVWINDFQPELIYSMLGSNRLLKLVLDINADLKVPIVPHFMDDWPSTLYRGLLWSKLLRRILVTRLHAVLAQAEKGFTIGEEMAAEYATRYDMPFAPFMNCIASEFLSQKAVPPPCRKVIRFSYIGGLHLFRWQSLRDIGFALKTLADEGYPTEAFIYTHPEDAAQYETHLAIPPIMHIAGSLTPQEVLLAQAEADVLIHVESFDKDSRQYTRYSISTKIPEYMATGRPIFAYGPEEIASIRYIRQSGCGIVVTNCTQSALVHGLRQLIVSSGLREQLGRRAREVACVNHDSVRQREAFRSRLWLIAHRASSFANETRAV